MKALAPAGRLVGQPNLREVVSAGAGVTYWATNERAVRAYQKLGFVRVGDTVAHPTIPVLREQRMVRPA